MAVTGIPASRGTQPRAASEVRISHVEPRPAKPLPPFVATKRKPKQSRIVALEDLGAPRACSKCGVNEAVVTDTSRWPHKHFCLECLTN